MFNAASTNLIWARLSWSVCSDGACTRGTSVGPSSCEAPLAGGCRLARPLLSAVLASARDNHLLEVRLALPSHSSPSGPCLPALWARVACLRFRTASFFFLFPSRHLTSDRLHFSFPANPLQIQFSPLLPLWSSAESWTSSHPATCCYMSWEVTDISSNIDL